ncbi:MAG: ABC transporter permease [Elusimicrobia bacterium]|nr:ABC transporter permease [Candidatus Obscuribacterium magneticum]
MKMNFQPSRVLSIALKEVRHIVRDPFTLAFALGLPIILVTFFGFAIDFNVRDIKMAVYDGDNTMESRTLLDVFSSSEYFRIENVPDPDLLIGKLDAGAIRSALVINPGFAKSIGTDQQGKAQVIMDGSDNSTAGVIVGYVGAIQQVASERLVGLAQTPVVNINTRFLFNPELNSKWFVVPGLAVVVLAILSILLTALTIAREWEFGSMELLLSTPVKPIEIILGKLAPYTVLGLAAVILVYLVARLSFGIPFTGSHLLFSIGCLMFITTYLAQGLLISVLTRKQQISMQFAIVSGLLPSILLSGFIFPIESMPGFFQYFTAILPARWFMVISRGLFLKSISFNELMEPFAALLLLDIVFIGLAAKKFKKDVEP